jgi:CrcB protein
VRWRVGGWVMHHSAGWRFPLGTFVVNVVGCLIAGVLAGLVVKRDLFAADTRLFLFTGLLGGFTTFSAFGVESVYLLRRGDYGIALAYIVSSLVGGVLGVLLGMCLIRERA